MNKKLLVGLALVAMRFWAPCGLSAASLTIGWDANTTDSDLAGFKLYMLTQSMLGMSPSAAVAAGVQPITINCTASSQVTQYTVSGLTAPNNYFFRLTAFDTSGNESAFNQDASGNNAEVATTQANLGNLTNTLPGGKVGAADVQMAINQTLAGQACSPQGDVTAHTGACSATDIRKVINIVLGL